MNARLCHLQIVIIHFSLSLSLPFFLSLFTTNIGACSCVCHVRTNLPLLFNNDEIIHLMIYMHITISFIRLRLFTVSHTRSFEKSTCYHYLNEKKKKKYIFIHTLARSCLSALMSTHMIPSLTFSSFWFTFSHHKKRARKQAELS